MEITKIDTVLNIECPVEAGICQVESDSVELCQTLNDIAGINKVRIDARKCEVIDTAYLQLLLSLTVSLQRQSIALEIQGMSNSFETLYKLYGITLGHAAFI